MMELAQPCIADFDRHGWRRGLRIGGIEEWRLSAEGLIAESEGRSAA